MTSAKADGYTLLFTSIAVTQNPAVFRNMPDDPLKDLIAIANFGESSTLVAVSADKIPSRTLGEFIALLKRSPPKTYNIAGAGGQRMTMEKFMLQFGVALEQVNYRSGGDAAVALISGDVHLQLNNATTLASGVRSGKIRLLAVAGETRLSAFPDVPTTAEAGFPDYIEKAHVGLYAASATPRDIVARLHTSVMRAIASPEVQRTMATLDYVPSQLTQAQADACYRSEVQRWKDVARKANLPYTD